MTTALDPLYEAFFRPTISKSAAPATPTGPPKVGVPPRSRAGNGMRRTRQALLDGARRAVERSGTRITMSQVAAGGGVAKATLYNHFRTREAVLDALVQDELETLIARFAEEPLAAALAGVAETLSAHPLLHALSQREPAVLAALAQINPKCARWVTARAAVDRLLASAGRSGGETVLRWLASYLVSPASATSIAGDLDILIAGLPGARAAEGPAVEQERTA